MNKGHMEDEMKKITKKKLNEILEKHQKWLEGKEGGERAEELKMRRLKDYIVEIADEQIKSLTTQDVCKLFKKAQAQGVEDKFSDLFWTAVNRIRNQATASNMQSVVDNLEAYKRFVGRKYNEYDKKNPSGPLAKWLAGKYNDVEYNIRWLVDEYHCTRKSKPYLFEK